MIDDFLANGKAALRESKERRNSRKAYVIRLKSNDIKKAVKKR